MKLSPEFERRLADIGGRLPNGRPKLRIVAPHEAVHMHGVLQGTPKYIDPTTGKQPECLTLEMAIPRPMLGPKDTWPEFLGPYPGDCELECCEGQWWGLKCHLTDNQGNFARLNESLIESIERKHRLDIQFAEKDAAKQLDVINEQKASADKREAESAFHEHNEIMDTYLQNKEAEDNADNRVFSYGGDLATVGKNHKMPVGKATDRL